MHFRKGLHKDLHNPSLSIKTENHPHSTHSNQSLRKPRSHQGVLQLCACLELSGLLSILCLHFDSEQNPSLLLSFCTLLQFFKKDAKFLETSYRDRRLVGKTSKNCWELWTLLDREGP